MLQVVSSSSKDRFIPLKNVAVQVNIHSFAAEVRIKQVFINSEESSVPIEAVYCFPVEEQAAIYSFEATLDDGRKIQAQIKEKKTAQREYCQALKKGHGAFLLEQDEKSNDIFTISVGSLKPQAKCEIEICYVQELDLIDDGRCIQFTLPTTIAPRYSSVSVGDGHIKSPGASTTKYVQSAPYTISFSCAISSLPIASVNSPSHPIQVTLPLDNESNSAMNVSLVQENTHLDRDIILNIDLKQEQVLTYTLVEKQALMISLVPTLELCDKRNQNGQINCEYIFVVDCSGSMADENKIGYAQQAISIFLRSLPTGSYFNIFRFGSNYEQFQRDQITIEYTEQTAKQAADYINNMKADLGGTELYSVLFHLQNTPPKTNYSRQLFLLTDGEITDVDKVLRLCHSMVNTTRIYSFGLGSAPSHALVKGLARVTNGSYLFIPPKTRVDVAVARQLDKALEPCLVNVKVQCHFDNNDVKDYRISPKILPPIHAKQRCNVYVMLPKNIEGTISGSIEFRTENNDILERVILTATQPSSSLLVTRLAAKSVLADLQTDDYRVQASRQKRFAEQQEDDKKQEMINISIEHQILSPFTAFIGIETRTEQEIAATASAGEMILREVPIEISENNKSSIDYNSYMQLNSKKRCVSSSHDMIECCADEASDDDISLNLTPSYSPSFVPNSSAMYRPELSRSHKKFVRSSSTSCSSKRQCISYASPTIALDVDSASLSNMEEDDSLSKDEYENDNSPLDILRQMINLQKFSGLWSINDLKQIITLLQQSTANTVVKDVDVEKILHDYKSQDNDVILSMIIMFIFTKYFLDDESLWKPLMKKCGKAMENRLGHQEYNELADKIKKVV